jgi:hypothetical protein
VQTTLPSVHCITFSHPDSVMSNQICPSHNWERNRGSCFDVKSNELGK